MLRYHRGRSWPMSYMSSLARMPYWCPYILMLLAVTASGIQAADGLCMCHRTHHRSLRISPLILPRLLRIRN